MLKLLALALLGATLCTASKEEGEKYLAEKAGEEGVYKLPSGMLVKVLKKGDGKRSPKANTPALCHYHGTLMDGSKFDSSVERGQPTTFAPNQVIKGWTEAMQYMCEGDKWHLMIPYGLAYGERGRPPKIPAFAPLNFDIEILEVKGDGGKECNPNALEQAVAGEL